tara:strand:+ start:265 stop:453 length:189 start_codon:yes stop_codon:yes gene_type:complete
MIVCVGDYVQLKQNFYGSNDAWLKVKDVEPYDILVLSNGARVPALENYIREVITAFEIREGK